MKDATKVIREALQAEGYGLSYTDNPLVVTNVTTGEVVGEWKRRRKQNQQKG